MIVILHYDRWRVDALSWEIDTTARRQHWTDLEVATEGEDGKYEEIRYLPFCYRSRWEYVLYDNGRHAYLCTL